ncbi:ATP-binding protein [Ktedonospora formicarum]|uniref:AAA+ ATPase domain-containing protein n=1 Tax=Ktedonospora formicarum TaxID=2778364 RepID=A0A8J3MSQ4_9CHLR|nr:ATP-binding protein [Ktedonospora formicarum]GHO45101.1 hypothetical protein KSX_32640 [Ktedonospora formicarum]
MVTHEENVTTSFMVNARIAGLMQEALYSAQGLAVLRNVVDDEASQAVLKLFRLLTSAEQVPMQVAAAYSDALRVLADSANKYADAALPDAWQCHLVKRLVRDENAWTRQVELLGSRMRAGQVSVSPTLHRQAVRELRALQRLFALSAELIWEAVQSVVSDVMPVLSDAWEPWLHLGIISESSAGGVHTELMGQVAQCQDWGDLADALEQHWARHGSGVQSENVTLRWRGDIQALEGIIYPDPIRLDNIVGYERELGKLRANLERFLAGLPAHDALLYGPPGTGKSSSVKALVNTYVDQGLRLVEVSKNDIGDLPRIVAQLRARAPRYVLFIDDLSFEDYETGYKVLKTLLEGTAEARPRNVLIYVTSNRLNLVREFHADRGKPGDEVNWRDTMDEKQSLVHRFGLRVTFSAPNQEQYVQIAQRLAVQRGLAFSEEDVRERALQWERQRVGRSGRLARQFVDDLEAEAGS